MENNRQNILLAVCGSISAYRSIDIARGLVNAGHSVRVILTSGAQKFVLPQVYRYLGMEVYCDQDDFNPQGGQAILHMDLSRWCDRLVIAPLSANTLAKLAYAAADDLLSTTFLALPEETPRIIFPAMNTRMLNNSLVEKNLQTIRKLKNTFIHPPAFGELACGELGEGKLPDTEKIVEIVPIINFSSNSQKKILISSGATVAPMDSVRYLTNPSSGITGFFLAKEALSRGYQVVLVAGINSTRKIDFLEGIGNCRVHKVATTRDAFAVIKQEIQDAEAYLSSAAMGDIEFPIHRGKIKKEDLQDVVPVRQSIDILSHVLKEKRKGQKIVGFAAETELTEEMMRMKWEKKPVDLLVGTVVDNGLMGDVIKGFGEVSTKYNLFKNGEIVFSGTLNKQDLACEILNRIF
ncbi:MAG: bifunctional phosphopantothenoylcysteine decarboxylase/phosphopantothenate--cysteine ligase CoaBC [Halobacteriovoraceae bacterium]|nr:bifunctional phosphopantothenoylcysteine decarboxylase/phosphopantothenate--cysteine ligase CoaBC [Halobacteriovoraceae bacterium]